MTDNNKILKETGTSGLWQIAAGVWQTIVRLLASMVLARVLSPVDFGIFGMAFLGRSFIERIGYFSFDTGMIAKQNIEKSGLCTCFWMNCIIRCLLFLLTLLVAPAIAKIFKTPQLTMILRCLALTFLFTIPSFIPSLLLRKELKFAPIAIINMIAATLESLIAISLVLTTDLRYWALVLSVMMAMLFIHLAIFAYKIWLPSLLFSWDSFKYLTRYGFGGLGANIAAYFQGNIDYLIIGRLLGPATLGLYEFAYRIPHLIQERVALPVSEVLLPAFSKFQSCNDDLCNAYLKVTRHMAFIALPVLATLATVADFLVPLLWGDKWLSIIPALKILCACAALNSIFLPIDHLFNCKNRPGVPFKFGTFRALLTGILIYFLCNNYGLIGVAWGMLSGAIFSILYAFYAFRWLSVSFVRFIAAIFPPVLSALCLIGLNMAAAGFMVSRSFNEISCLFSLSLIGIVCYLIVFRIFFKNNFQEIIKTIKLLTPFFS